MVKRILVTGCAGFIGSNFVRYTLETYPDNEIVGLDKLTYAGRLDNLTNFLDDERFSFTQGDICDEDVVEQLMAQDIDAVVNFAADSMVDRGLLNPGSFLQTNFVGVNTLLRATVKNDVKRFLQISTQEVYGHVLHDTTDENARLDPHNLYAACKAGAEKLAGSYMHSYGLEVVFTRGSNAIGPQQHIEKVVPQFVTNAIDDEALPIYGDGSAMRDYIHVDDLNAANNIVLRKANAGEAYNVFSGDEKSLLELAKAILTRTDKPLDLIKHIGDRVGHDYRYYLDAERVRGLGWKPRYTFDEVMDIAVEWYMENEAWWRQIKDSDDYQEYLKRNYKTKESI